MPRSVARALTALAAAAVAALSLAACGDDGGGDADPKQVLEATFGNEAQAASGVIDFSFEQVVEGEQGGEISLTFGGPFQRQEGQVAQFDIEGEVSLDSPEADFSGGGGLTSTGDRAFVNYQGTDYEVPQDAVQEFASTFNFLQQQDEGQGQDDSQQLVDSLTDLSNEGNEDVEGTETTHITGRVDVAKFIDLARTNLDTQAESVPQGQLDQLLSGLAQLQGAVENASFDVYTGTDDDILRKLVVDLELDPPDEEATTIDLSLTLSDVNEPQTISGPSAAQPLSALLEQLGLDPATLGQLGAGLGASSGSVPQAGGSPQAPSGGASQDYLDCLQTAETTDALNECAALLE